MYTRRLLHIGSVGDGQSDKDFPPSSPRFHVHFDSTVIIPAWGLMGCDLLMRIETTISMLTIRRH